MVSLPSVEKGYLPYLLIYTGVSALIHSVVTYTSPIAGLKQFSGPAAPPKNALTAHVYGIKNVYTGLIRLYAAYNITNPDLYNLAISTFVGVLALYGGEYFIWKTAGTREVTFPFITAGTGLVWMLVQKSWYLQN